MTSPAQLRALLIADRLIGAAKASNYPVNSELAGTIIKAAANILSCQDIDRVATVGVPATDLPDSALFLRFIDVINDERLTRSRMVVSYLEELCDDIILYDADVYGADDDDEDDDE